MLKSYREMAEEALEAIDREKRKKMKKTKIISLVSLAAAAALVIIFAGPARHRKDTDLAQGNSQTPRVETHEVSKAEDGKQGAEEVQDEQNPPGEEHDPEGVSSPGEKVLNKDYAMKQKRGYRILGQALAAKVPQNPESEEVYAKSEKEQDRIWETYRAYQMQLDALNKEVTYLPAIYQYTEEMNKELLNDPTRNGIYSPLNSYMAMSMLAETAGGKTQKELLDLLQLKSLEDNRKNADLMQRLNEYSDGISTIHTANALWLQKDGNYEKETIDRLSQVYGASTFAGNFGDPAYDQALQSWLNKNTGNLLEEEAGEEVFDPSTVCSLSSAMHFKDRWSEDFAAKRTQKGSFHGQAGDSQVDFMHQTLVSSPIYQGKSFDALRKGFQSGASLWFIRPQNGAKLEDLLADAEVSQMLQNPDHYPKRQNYEVEVSLPKFDVKSFQSLVAPYKHLGLQSAFDAQKADFSSLMPGAEAIRVDSIDHACRLLINEEGAEAAAFTVIMKESAALEADEKYEFKVDQPFLLALTGMDGAPLVVAKIVDLP